MQPIIFKRKNMNLKNITILFSIFFLFTACIKEDYFGESSSANIKKFQVSNQSGNAVINADDATVTVEIPGGVDLSGITIQVFELSSFASSNFNIGSTIDLNNDFSIALISENGTKRIWTIKAFVASATPQLVNRNLNKWYQTATSYYEPGESATTTIWGTGNRGTQLLNKLATVPKDLGSGNLAAQMETLTNGPLGTVFGAPISAGSIFTGFFNADKIDPANPAAAVEFGTPFAGRPIAVKLKYSYVPGAINKSKNGTVLTSSDACDIYALLEIRTNNKTRRLATAWFRSTVAKPTLITLEIPFIYGKLDGSFPDYSYPINNLYVASDEVSYILPTHISFVASSSYDGANFSGAVGSKLVIDDVELLYK